ncbi:MAG: glycerophosphodiester phosphodiesterase family protein [Pirellulales bacterium]|nr:glycerophosphodiester phosphodiesterase family protein [Pirellulales bacterium]
MPAREPRLCAGRRSALERCSVVGVPRLAALVLALLASRASAEIEVVCHRGANEHCPENTYAATRKCVEWGVAYVEIDVRTSKDGVLYILHDASVNRTTDGQGLLRSLTSDEIDKLDAGSWFDPSFAGERVPRLEPYLRWIKGKAKVYFDVKDADLKQLAKLVYDVGLENDCFFWFDNPRRALEFRQLDAKLPLKVNVRTVDDVRQAKERYQANIVEVGVAQLTPEVLSACRERGLKVMAYEPRKNEDAFQKIIEAGADLVNLNHGDVFLEVERRLQAK